MKSVRFHTVAAFAALVLLFAPLPAAAVDRWSTAEEWEDADLALFFTGELRGYVEPCG